MNKQSRAISKTPDHAIYEEAADWLMRIHAEEVSEEELAAFRRWRAASEENEQACRKAEVFASRLNGLNPQLATHVLNRRKTAVSRRNVIGLVAFACLVPISWESWHKAKRLGWMADYSTALGNRRKITLPDGTLVTLNTASAINVHFDNKLRCIELVRGEILVRTAADNTGLHRPLVVDVGQGRMVALGTRFNVRQYDDKTRIAVFEGAVRIEPSGVELKDEPVLKAGEQTSFTRQQVMPFTPAGDQEAAWIHGMFPLSNQPLISLVNELKRYHRGYFTCDDAIAGMRISGSYPVDDLKGSLGMLQSTYPVVASSRLGGYWVSVRPR